MADVGHVYGPQTTLLGGKGALPTESFEILWVSVAMFGFAGSGLGLLSVIFILVATAILTFIAVKREPSRMIWAPLVLAYPLFQVASTIWSLAPDVTLRYSAELFLTGAVGVVSVLVCSPLGLLIATYLATTAVLFVSIINGTQGPAAEGMVLVGIMGSKNAMALLGQLVFQSGLAVVFSNHAPKWIRLSAIPVMALACYIAVTEHAFTSLFTLILGIIAFFILLLTGLVRRGARILLLVVGGILSAFAAWLGTSAIASDANEILRSLNKDPTLTGRTTLWDFARAFAAERPWLGRGYKEVWLGNSPDTVGLLHWAGVDDGRTFFFHHTYLEAQVDSGYIGLSILIITFVAMAIAYLLEIVRGASAASLFFITMFLLLMVRSFGETLMQPFSHDVCILYMGFGIVLFQTKRSLFPKKGLA